MAFLDRFNQSPSGDELMAHLRNFLYSVRIMHQVKHQAPEPEVRAPLTGVDLTHTSVYLMKHLPVSRDAVLQYLSDFYNQFVEVYIDTVEGLETRLSEQDMALLEEVHTALIGFINHREDIWAPTLSTWTIRLLGEFSRQYAGRRAFLSAQTVNDVINLWMPSKAIHSLLEITSRCLHCSEEHRGDFMSTLLDTSARHSPYFDWVVAYVGNTCPQKVIKEVANVGLSAFSKKSREPSSSSKVDSVVGILGHLVCTQSEDVKLYFEGLLQEALSGSADVSNHAIPYLLRLCRDSSLLLDVLVDTIIPMINESTLSKLELLAPAWIKKYYKGYDRALSAYIAHLILKSTRGPHLINILLHGCKTWKDPARCHTKFILDRIRADILSKTIKWDPTLKCIRSFPCIPALRENYTDLLPFLSDSNPDILSVSKSLLTALSFYDGYEVGVESICYFFRVAKTDAQIWSLVDLIGTLVTKYPSILKDCTSLLMVKYGKVPYLQLWKTMIRIVKSESLPQFPNHFKLSTAIRDNLNQFTQFLNTGQKYFSLQESSLVVELLSNIPNITYRLKFGIIVTIERYLIDLLFHVLGQSSGSVGGGRAQKVRTVAHISRLLQEFSKEQAVQNDALRSLVQSSLDPECRQLFQSRVPLSKVIDEEEQIKYASPYTSLWNENQKRSASISLARVHSSSFHSGKLMKGSSSKIKWPPNSVISLSSASWNGSKVDILENDDAKLNIQLLLSVLTSICIMAHPINSHFGPNGYVNGASGKPGNFERTEPAPLPLDVVGNGGRVSVDATRKVALLLVEIVSPDVMFNGLPWPDEEFSKIQVERDLQIRRAMEDHPYLWDLLEFVANYSPSLCYCSVLMRALMATLIAHWTSCQEANARSTPTQLEWTIRLLNIMKTGEIIPPPLCYIGDVLHELKACEIVGLLKDIWCYMKLNVPVPTAYIQDPKTQRFVRNSEFIKFDPVFAEKLRLAVLNNVERLGHLYSKLFPLKQENQNRPSLLAIEFNGHDGNGNKDEKSRPPQIQSPSPTKETTSGPFLHNTVKTVPL